MGNKNTKIQQYATIVRNQRNIDIQKQLNQIRQLKQQLHIDQKLENIVSQASAAQLAQLLNQKILNSKILVTIFAYKAATIGMELNLLTQDNFNMAYKLAEQCDKIRSQTDKRNWTLQDTESQENFLPALYGVPLSVKDAFDMEGKRTTLGVTARSHIVKQKDCGIVSCLKQAGMIPFVRTNVPQLTMIFQSNNLLWGRSLNIWNKDRTVGGSSGGEAGLIAARCSPIGIGTDIGGSLRIPAEFCGICSLKPSQTRLSQAISQSTEYSQMVAGKDTFLSVNGPLARSVDDLALWLKVVLNQKYQVDKDPYTKLLPFDHKTYFGYQKYKKLKIGYFASHQLLETTTASQRAVYEVVQFLERQGHQLIQVKIPHFTEMIQQFFSEVSCEGKVRSFQSMLEGQDFIPEYSKVKIIAKMPIWLKKLVKVVLRKIAPRMATIAQKTEQLTVAQYLVHVGKIQRYRKEVYQMWKQLELNHIIAPGFGCQANLHGLSSDISPAAIYTLIWNMTGYTAGSLPVTVVKMQEQRYESRHQDMITSALKKTAEGSVGLPVGVQVIGLPFQQQKVLGLMKTIEERFQFNKHHRPHTLA